MTFRSLVTPSLVVLWAGSASASSADQTGALTSLDLSFVEQGYGSPQVDQSVANHPLSMGGTHFAHGLGTHADSSLHLNVNGAKQFTATVGIDDEVGKLGEIRFPVIGDNKALFDSGIMRGGDAGKPVNVNLAGVKRLQLIAVSEANGINYCHADCTDAQFIVEGLWRQKDLGSQSSSLTVKIGRHGATMIKLTAAGK